MLGSSPRPTPRTWVRVDSSVVRNCASARRPLHRTPQHPRHSLAASPRPSPPAPPSACRQRLAAGVREQWIETAGCMPCMKADGSRATRRDPDVLRAQSSERGVQLLAGLQHRVSHRLQQRRDVGNGPQSQTSSTLAIFIATSDGLSWSRTASDALEVLLDLPSREPQHDRPAVRADARVGRPAQLGEDVAHLLERQRIVRLHRGMAGHRRGDAAQRVLDAGAGLDRLRDPRPARAPPPRTRPARAAPAPRDSGRCRRRTPRPRARTARARRRAAPAPGAAPATARARSASAGAGSRARPRSAAPSPARRAPARARRAGR